MSDGPMFLRNESREISEEYALTLVNRNGHNIRKIKNPTFAVKLAAIKESAFCIQYILDAERDAVDPALVCAAIDRYPLSYNVIQNFIVPTDEMKMALVVRSPFLAKRYITDLTPEIEFMLKLIR